MLKYVEFYIVVYTIGREQLRKFKVGTHSIYIIINNKRL